MQCLLQVLEINSYIRGYHTRARGCMGAVVGGLLLVRQVPTNVEDKKTVAF